MRLILNIMLMLILGYVLVALLVFIFQARLIYFPQAAQRFETTPETLGLSYEELQLRTSDGNTIHGWWVPKNGADGAILLFHGNAGNISHRLSYLKMFHELGYAVLIIDYRGYGKSTGTPSENGTYLDAEAAWGHIVEKLALKPQDVIIVGESLGGGVASWLAAKRQPRAVILASTFTSLKELGAQHYPWLPVRLISRIHYDNLERLSQIHAPLLIAHSRDDEIVPYAHGEALFSAAREPKQFMVMNGGHNESFIYSRPEWVKQVARFLDRHRAGAG